IGTDAKGDMAIEPRPIPGQPPLLLPLGNSLDGILLDNVNNVTIGGTTPGSPNVISGNLGRGIEVRGDLDPGKAGTDLISSNFIGTNLGGTSVTQSNPSDPSLEPSLSLGNLGDGIFLLDATGTVIQGLSGIPSVISGNRGAGIHAVGGSGLSITGNFIGTDVTGNNAAYTININPNDPTSYLVSFGNASDGVFLDQVTNSTIGGTSSGSGNVISGNRSNGIDLLQSSGDSVYGNVIGAGSDGLGNSIGGTNSQFNNLANASNGIFVNRSSSIKIGGSVTGSGNTISGNLGSGLFLSGITGSDASDNLIQGNWIGLGHDGKALPNATSGVVISGANNNLLGATVAGALSGPLSSAANLIAGNR